MSKNRNKNKSANTEELDQDSSNLEGSDQDSEGAEPNEDDVYDPNDSEIPQVELSVDPETRGLPLVGVDEEPDDYEVGTVESSVFQSPQAAAAANKQKATDGDRVIAAAIAPIPVKNAKRIKPQDEERMVTVRPIKTENRFFVGRDQYQIVAGRRCQVPLRVARLLEEKGYLGFNG